MSTWFLALRPTARRATAGRASRRCSPSSAAGCRRARRPTQIVGDFPESVDGQQRQHAKLRVLLSGPAATASPATLEHRAGDLGDPRSAARPTARRRTRRRAPRARLLVARTSPRRSGACRELTDAPLILAAYGEPNGIVETGLAVGAADVLVLPQPAETLLFAIRKAAMAAPRHRTGKVVTVFSPKGGSGKTVLATNLAVAAARSGARRCSSTSTSSSATPRSRWPLRRGRRSPTSRPRPATIDAEKLKAFVSTDPRTGVAVLPAPQRPEEADVGRPGGARRRARRRPQRLRRGRRRHRPALRRRDARRARPHRPAAARLQPRGDVAQERPHRARDDRPARLRPRARLARRQPHRRRRRRRPRRHRAARSTRRSRTSCPTIRAFRPRSTGHCRSWSPTRRSPFARALAELAAVGLRRRRRPSSTRSRASAASSCEAGDEHHRPQQPHAQRPTPRSSPSASTSNGAPCAHAPATRTPS